MELLLDTGIFVIFFKKEKEYDKVKTIIDEIEGGGTKALISSITLSEIFYVFARYSGEDFARIIIDYIKSSPINALPVTDSVAEKAGELKFKYGGKQIKKGLPLADCIIAATALENNAVLVTHDKHFEKIKSLKTQWV